MNVTLLTVLLFAQGLVAGGQTGSVSGHISNLDGTPAARIRVAAQWVAESPAAAGEAPVLSSIVQTDNQGNYRLEGMMPGRFYIFAGLIDLPTYYPGVASLSSARVVTVPGGAVISGIDFQMVRPAALTVRGRVKVEDGATMPPNARVLMRSDSRSGNRDLIVSADGTFSFEGVPPGRYTIFVTPPNGSLGQEIVLNDKDVDVEFVIQPTVAANGKVVVEGDGPRPRVNLLFTLGTITVATAGVSANGTFTVQFIPGNYRLSVNPLPPGYRVKSVTAGAMDWLKDGLVVQKEVPIPEFVVALDVDSPAPWVKVRGHVTGSVPSGTNIALTGTNAGEILRAEVGRDGTFEFPRVIPGPYTARLEGNIPAAAITPLQITVGSTDLDNVEIALPRIASVSGRVVVEEGETFWLTRLTFSMSGNGVPNRSVSVAVPTKGAFSLNLPDGEYSLTLNTQQNNLTGYSVKSLTYGTANLMNGPVKVSASDAGKELIVTLEKLGGAKISGRVTHSPGGDIQISMSGGGMNIGGSNSIYADGNGAFEIPDVPAGSYTLRAFAVSGGIDVSAPIDVQPGKDVSGFEIPFPPQHGVDGKIVLENDPGIAFRPRFSLTLTGSRTITVYTTASSNGTFTARFPLGDWSVAVGGLPTDVTLKSFTYGDTNLLSEKIHVVENDTKELRMSFASKQTMVRVAGRIILAPGTAMDRELRLAGNVTVEAPVNADGTFEFPKIFSGSYDRCCTYGWTRITVPNHDVTDMVLRGISGRVVMEAGVLDRGLVLSAGDGNLISAASVGTDGSFTFILAEGSFRFQMSAVPEGSYVKSITYGTKELLNQTFDFMRNVPIANLTVTIAKRP